MADVSAVAGQSLFGDLARTQYAAVMRMRGNMLIHSLRSSRGKFEVAARIFWIGFFALVALGLAAGTGFLSYQLARDRELALLPLVLWPVLVMWQTVPIMLASAQESVDFNFLLRFPVSFRSYCLLYLFFGIFDPASLLGGVSLLGIFTGIVLARHELAPWAALVLALFALLNFFLTRTIFAWIERWLARRRSREILGMVFLGLFLGLQLLNPALHGGSHSSWTNPATIRHIAGIANTAQRPLPPGLAARSIELMDKGRITPAIALFAAMAAYVAGIGCLLGMRLRAEYRGESLGEAPSRVTARTTVRAAAVRHRNSRRHALNGPVAAILEKELLYLSRSGVMLFALLTPLIVLFGVGGRIRTEHTSEVGFLFPFAVAYAFLPMTRQVCNSLGAEGAGIQLYFLAPTAFRTVMLGKNLLQVAMFCVELVLVCLIVVSRYGMPRPLVLIATFGWLLFALPANLAAGNILSICLPYRMTLTRLSREQGSVGNGLLSLLIQLIVFAIGVALYAALVATGHSGFITPAFLILAVGGIWLWLRVLSNVDRLAARRREALIEAIVRTA